MTFTVARCMAVIVMMMSCACIRVSVVDCGDRAADWLRSFLNIENIRLVRRRLHDVVSRRLSSDDASLMNDAKQNITESLCICY